ncbi:MBL fold metallo-hydrolase [Roseomonas eburnea]|uniref:MBL fold metallo-hydrolase n=2 Tax=Neoroseomonas eburnea TaxID=1346889 RepID=A0A9X9XD90_9PROT|nr:MBL fold metallo-hydrolase [Neoroseomonas eburnea]MBR0681676.1 MBL fold metallo-hydrolase [Neoroseomonas eburnea]
MLGGDGARWPRRLTDPPHPPPAPPPPGHVAVTAIGHASFCIAFSGGPVLLTDPVWSERASPFRFIGPRRARPPGQQLEALPRPDAVLVSHNHYDHLDLATLRRIARLWAPPVLTGLGNAALIARAGLDPVRELDWWQTHRLPGGHHITYLPMRHGSARGLGDRCRALWGGFAVETSGGVRAFFCGDSAWGPHFAEIGERLGPFDVAMVPIGAYDPRWFMRTVHMDVTEALQAHHTLRARTSIAMHFGVFKLTREPIGEPAQRLIALRGDADFRIPAFGETLTIPLSRSG